MKVIIVEGDPGRTDSLRVGVLAVWPDSEVQCVSSHQSPQEGQFDGVGLVVMDCQAHDSGLGQEVARLCSVCDGPVVVAGGPDDVAQMAEALSAGATDYVVMGPDKCGLAPLVFSRCVTAYHNERQVEELRRQVTAQQAAIADRDRELREAERIRQEMSMTDTLTELVNRRQFSTLLRRELKRMHRYGLALSCLMIDVDHFRHVNNDFGHAVGDLVLRGLAKTLMDHARHSDVVARYGAEEFVVLLPHTPKEGAIQAAERIREAIVEGNYGTSDRPVQITVSIGVSCYPDPEMSAEDHLVQDAEGALRKAKSEGRNRVGVHGHDPRIED